MGLKRRECTCLSWRFGCQGKKRESEAVRREKCGGICEALRREKSEGGFSSHNTEDREQEWGFFGCKSLRKKRSTTKGGRRSATHGGGEFKVCVWKNAW